MASVKKKPATPKKSTKMTAAQRARMAEKARQQWSDPNSKLRQRHLEGNAEKRKRPPRHAAELIRAGIAEFGQNVGAICEMLQCARQTFYEWLKRHPEIKEAYESGRSVMEEKLVSKLYAQAMAGYSPAGMFLLRAKFHYRDSGPIPDQQPESPAEQAAKIREALKAMRAADGLEGGNEDAPYASKQG